MQVATDDVVERAGNKAGVAGASEGARTAPTAESVPAKPGPLRRVLRRVTASAAPTASARLATLLGLLTVLDSIWARHWQLLAAFELLPTSADATTTRVGVAMSGLVLLRIAAGLRRRKRAEWRLAVIASAAVCALDLARTVERPFQASLAGLLLAVLVLGRSAFTARSDPRDRSFTVRSGLLLLLGSSVTGMVLLYLPGHVPAHTTFLQRIGETFASLVGLGGTISVGGDAYGDTFHALMLALGLVTIGWTILLAVRPAGASGGLGEQDETKLRALLARHGGRDSLGYFALRRDKQVVWSPTGKAAVTYRVVSGVALASADPIGDPEAWPGAIHAFGELAESYGWSPAVMGCSEQGASIYRRELGMNALELGDEAVLDTDAFCLSGRSMRGVRQACARVERAGYTVRIQRTGELSEQEVAALRAHSDAWRVDSVERGFSMALSRLGAAGDENCVVVTALQDGEVRGLLHFVPWGTDGLSLDLMRRDRESDNGLNEFMIAAVMEACAGLGVTRVSLNFAVFRDALERGARIGAGPVSRLWRRVLLIASAWWQIDSLFRFNSKFRPRWEPRFVSYARARDIPRISLAALEAEAFLVRPALVSRLIGRP